MKKNSLAKQLYLKRITLLFGGLNETELEALAERAVARRLARGEVLLMAGDDAAGLFVGLTQKFDELQFVASFHS